MDEENKNHDFDFPEFDDMDDPVEVESEQPSTKKHLHRSIKHSIIFGVCGGIGEYFNIDPVIIRLIFTLSILIGGWGVIAYLIAAFLMDPPPRRAEYQDTTNNFKRRSALVTIIGAILLLTGLYFILSAMGFHNYLRYLDLFHGIAVPITFLVLGGFLLFGKKLAATENDERKDLFKRSVQDKIIFGVCAGLAGYLNVRPFTIRALWIVSIFCTLGFTIIPYILFVLFTEKESDVVFDEYE